VGIVRLRIKGHGVCFVVHCRVLYLNTTFQILMSASETCLDGRSRASLCLLTPAKTETESTHQNVVLLLTKGRGIMSTVLLVTSKYYHRSLVTK
jgi:hypothetical protein